MLESIEKCIRFSGPEFGSRTLPIYFQQYSDLRAVSFLCQWKLTTTQIPISVAFDFSPAGEKTHQTSGPPNKW